MAVSPGNETVLADSVNIKKLGDLFHQWSEDLDQLYLKIDIAKITPGYLDAATGLSQRYDERKTAFLQVIKNLVNSLYEAGTELIKMANAYTTVEDLNKDDLERLNKLVNAVKRTYADLNVAPPAVQYPLT